MIGEHDETGAGAGATKSSTSSSRGTSDVHARRRARRGARGHARVRRDPATRRAPSPTRTATEILVIGGRPGAAFARSPPGSARPRRCGSGARATGTARSACSKPNSRGSAQRERALQPGLRREPLRAARRRDRHLAPAIEIEPGFRARARRRGSRGDPRRPAFPLVPGRRA